MQITEKLIRENICKAREIIEECTGIIVDAEFPIIKFGKSHTKWGSVSTTCEPNEYDLYISRIFEEIPNDSMAYTRLQSTVTHECIHTIKGCMNHGNKFKSICNAINKHYPQLQLQRCTSMSDYGIERKRSKYKYVIECTNCGNKYYYRKRSKFIDELDECWCGKCKAHALKFYEV